MKIHSRRRRSKEGTKERNASPLLLLLLSPQGYAPLGFPRSLACSQSETLTHARSFLRTSTG